MRIGVGGILSQDLGLKKMVSLCDINMTQMLEEDSNQGPLTGDFSKVSLVTPILYFILYFGSESYLLAEDTKFNSYVSSASTH